MATLFIGLCALACPVGMLGMMWMMRGSRHQKDSSDED
jgi:hypothetical protein